MEEEGGPVIVVLGEVGDDRGVEFGEVLKFGEVRLEVGLLTDKLAYFELEL